MKRILLTIILVGSLSGCGIENINNYAPVMYTDDPKEIVGTSAKLSGGVVGDGGSPVKEFGFVYAEHENPTIDDHKIAIGEGIKIFEDYFELFEPGHTYYYRTYGINDYGVGYSKQVIFSTTDEVPCNPEKNNAFSYYWEDYDFTFDLDVTLTGVDYDNDNLEEYGSGNLQFYAESETWDHAHRSFILQFLEYDKKLPKTGVYTTIEEFTSTEEISDNKVRLLASDYSNWDSAHAEMPSGQQIYVKNENGIITFIFCDISLGGDIVNGKFTYNP